MGHQSLMASGHGLDLTDESFYLVTYRWWDTYQPTFTGTQYLFGPLFEALGDRIDHLRVVRLALHLGVNAYLAFTLVCGWATARSGVRQGDAAGRWSGGRRAGPAPTPGCRCPSATTT